MVKFLTLVGFGLLAAAAADPTEVTVKDGPLKGSTRKSYTGKDYVSFQGIPYAAPPTGENRFRPPQDPAPWTGTLDASGELTVACAQSNEIFGTTYTTWNQAGDEDCLYLNVYKSESTPGSTGLPVIFWTYGGALMIGDAREVQYGADLLMEEEVVLVTYNYRLGALGFFTIGTEDAPGNQGWWDQQKALEWTNANIEAFGGDPNLITIMGESAGSWSTFSHLMSPVSDGLFVRAILESATVDMQPYWRCQEQEDAIAKGLELATIVGCNTWVQKKGGNEAIMKCMRAKPASTMTNNQFRVHNTDFRVAEPTTNMGYVGVKDTGLSNPPYLPDTPGALLRAGKLPNKNVDVLAGAVLHEGMFSSLELMLLPPLYSLYRGNWDHYGPLKVLGQENPDAADIKFVNDAADFYFGGMQNFNSDNWHKITDMYTDATFQYGVHRAAGLIADQTAGKVYEYRYTYNAEHHILNAMRMDGQKYGNMHTDELFNLFRPYSGFITRDTKLIAKDEEVSLEMVKMWVQFAKTGDLSSFNWDPVPDSTTSPRPYMDLGDEFKMTTEDYFASRMKFWDENMPWPK